MKEVELARESIKSYFTGKQPELKRDKKQGVFVTLHKGKQLRGCIGFPYPTHKLDEGIFHAAKAAAFEDPRFPPVEEDELDKIKIEVSVLSEPKKLECKPEDYTRPSINCQYSLISGNPLSFLLHVYYPGALRKMRHIFCWW